MYSDKLYLRRIFGANQGLIHALKRKIACIYFFRETHEMYYSNYVGSKKHFKKKKKLILRSNLVIDSGKSRYRGVPIIESVFDDGTRLLTQNW